MSARRALVVNWSVDVPRGGRQQPIVFENIGAQKLADYWRAQGFEVTERSADPDAAMFAEENRLRNKIEILSRSNTRLTDIAIDANAKRIDAETRVIAMIAANDTKRRSPWFWNWTW